MIKGSHRTISMDGGEGEAPKRQPVGAAGGAVGGGIRWGRQVDAEDTSSG